MAAQTTSNGSPPDPINVNGTAKTETTQTVRPKRPPKPNYAKIHSKPLPLDIHPLPAFVPQNPISLLRIAYMLLRDYFTPPVTQQSSPYTGYFSPETRCIHVTDPSHIRALWEMGFFGKGTLSRSEPSWLDRERARRIAGQGGTSEEVTSKRREERRLFKLERARAEREQIDLQLKKERRTEGTMGSEETVVDVPSKGEEGLGHVFPWLVERGGDDSSVANTHQDDIVDIQAAAADGEVQNSNDKVQRVASSSESQPDGGVTVPNGHPIANELASAPVKDAPVAKPSANEAFEITNQEHLQLSLEEAFFLAYALGVLRILPTPSSSATASTSPDSPSNALSIPTLFTLCRIHSLYPPISTEQIAPDNPFLLHYAVYHHYRSLGWVIRPGSKFSCDYLLYNRGPVFSHAEFAVIIVPDYGSAYEQEGRERRVKQKDWWWLHCVNRVQSQVRKSLVLCYVEVPDRLEEGNDIGKALRGYRVRDFVVRRWLANRSRD